MSCWKSGYQCYEVEVEYNPQKACCGDNSNDCSACKVTNMATDWNGCSKTGTIADTNQPNNTNDGNDQNKDICNNYVDLDSGPKNEKCTGSNPSCGSLKLKNEGLIKGCVAWQDSDFKQNYKKDPYFEYKDMKFSLLVDGKCEYVHPGDPKDKQTF